MKDKRLEIIDRLQEFIESEGRSCSMDPECITPLYVYRMWGGEFSMEEIENGLAELRKEGGNEAIITINKEYNQ